MARVLRGINDLALSADVVVVDDQPTSRIILETILRSIGDKIRVTGYARPLDALRDMKSGRTPDLIVADYYMPGLDGIEFTRTIRAIPACRDVPLVIITVVEQRKVMYEALEAGATDFLIKPVDHHECKVRCRNLLRLRRRQPFIRNRGRVPDRGVPEAAADVHEREREALSLLARVCAVRTRPTRDPDCVGKLARRIADEMGLAPEFCDCLELAAPLHDIGMLGLPDAVLLKQAPLTPEETGILQAHTRIGYDMLRHSTSPTLKLAARIALHHHEAFDGSGYPLGLSGDDIPVEARIVAVAQLLAGHGGARPDAAAMTEIREHSGRALDPACVDAALCSTGSPALERSGSLACEP